MLLSALENCSRIFPRIADDGTLNELNASYPRLFERTTVIRLTNKCPVMILGDPADSLYYNERAARVAVDAREAFDAACRL